MQSRAATVDAYLAEVPIERRPALEPLRALSKRVFPDAIEGVEYGMPVLKQNGVMAFAYASQKNYISLYGLGQDVLDGHRSRLTGAECGKGCLRYKEPDAIDFVLLEALMVEARDTRRREGG